jgi:hypothetical protein
MNVFAMIPSSPGNSSASCFVPSSTLRDRYVTSLTASRAVAKMKNMTYRYHSTLAKRISSRISAKEVKEKRTGEIITRVPTAVQGIDTLVVFSLCS